MSINRSSQRNNGSITEANFLDILGILLVVSGGPLRVQERISSHIVCRTEVPLEAGKYDIHCDASIQVNNELWIHRIYSHNFSRRDHTFRPRIRNRDRKCVISGIVNFESSIQADNWAGFEAAHIFPLQHERYWIDNDYGRWITDMDETPRSSKINSSQNGILLRADVVVFDLDRFGLDGRILDPVCRSRADPHRASKKLLRWHFRQSVLANMRGAGEPIFEDDFQPESDPVGEILAALYAHGGSEFDIPVRLREVS
ncbi:hypothetical protein HOY82DRAFT_641168 [Tuber indicum]|nr:hypothetical protein HOY82DRAFT_641168 [Tuber indicum]